MLNTLDVNSTHRECEKPVCWAEAHMIFFQISRVIKVKWAAQIRDWKQNFGLVQ